MHDSAEGQPFKAGKFRFVVCTDCAPKVIAAARVTGTVLQTGLAALVQAKAPGLLPILQQLRNAYDDARQETPR